MQHVLFLCSQNLQRSPTAEGLYRCRDDLAVRSAGVDPGAQTWVTEETLRWADVIFVFELAHWERLGQDLPELYRRLYVECLDVRDEYGFMGPEQIA